jgi:predicted dehydrogenase
LSKRFRTLLVGLGKIGATYAEDASMAKTVPYVTHAQALAAHPSFLWHGAVDTSPAANEFVRSRFDVERTGTAVEDIAGLEQVDVVVLATPPASRTRILDALPNVKAVLVEKPLGSTLEQSEAFVSECWRRGLVTQVNLTRRADGVVQELVRGGLNDRIGRVQCGFGTFGNGAVNYSMHSVDLVRMLVGEVTAVQAMRRARAFDEGPLAGDRNLSFTLFVGDVPVTLHPLRFSQYREGSLDLWGEKGRLEFLQEGLRIRETPRRPCRSLDGAYELDSDNAALRDTGYGRALLDLYDDLAAVLQGKRRATCSPCESALATERVVHAILESARKDGAVIEVRQNVAQAC